MAWSARKGDVESAKLLLKHGAEVNRLTSMGPPLVAAAQAGHTDVARLLLSKGAEVDRTSRRGAWTALMWAAANEYADPALASLLLENGASPSAKRGRTWGPFMDVSQSPLMIAKRRGETALVKILRKAGARSAIDPRDAKRPRSKTVSGVSPNARLDATALVQTVSAALPLLEHTATASQKEFVAQGFKCVSCHNQLIPSVALSLAKSKGFPRDEENFRVLLNHLKSSVGGIGGIASAAEPTVSLSAAVFSGYLLWGLGLEETKPNFGLDASVHALASFQEPSGNWSNHGPRAPIQASRISSTALALKGISAYPLPGRRSELEARMALSRDWLRKVEVRITEDYAFRLLGLHWTNLPAQKLETFASELLSLQRADGGWAQLPKLEKRCLRHRFGSLRTARSRSHRDRERRVQEGPAISRDDTTRRRLLVRAAAGLPVPADHGPDVSPRPRRVDFDRSHELGRDGLSCRAGPLPRSNGSSQRRAIPPSVELLPSNRLFQDERTASWTLTPTFSRFSTPRAPAVMRGTRTRQRADTRWIRWRL